MSAEAKKRIEALYACPRVYHWLNCCSSRLISPFISMLHSNFLILLLSSFCFFSFSLPFSLLSFSSHSRADYG